MKPFIVKLLIALLVAAQALPFAVSANFAALPSFAVSVTEENVRLSAPYEKVLASEGDWFVGRPSTSDTPALTVGYNGGILTGEESAPISFTTREEALVSDIYVSTAVSESLTLVDGEGNLYPGFEAVRVSEGTQVFRAPGEVRLPAGSYTAEGASGDFVIKGVNADGQSRYNAQRIEQAAEVLGVSAETVTAGEGSAVAEPSAESGTAGKSPAMFVLDDTYLIDEIMLNTFNSGMGAAPGVIAILDASNQVIYTQQAYGGTVGTLANGLWIIKPGILLPAGTYYIGSSDPSVTGYDAAGEPMFYLTAYPTVPAELDVTGTYRINVDTAKTSTIMGPVSGAPTPFLTDFELTVLHKEGFVELIGEYEGMPVSQNCLITSETENGLVAVFDFAVDLTGLPYKAKVDTKVEVTFTQDETGQVLVSFGGEAHYSRAASETRGADDNTYVVSGSGSRMTTALPPYVIAALGAAPSVGNIPGADSPFQNAAGILFPPLVGLVASVVQEALKKKEAARQGSKVVRDKAWYKEKYPEATDEQLAWIMLADAMGSTDEADEGDALSMGDNEGSEGYGGSGSDSVDGNGDGDAQGDPQDWSGEEEETESEAAAEEEAEPEQKPEQKPEPEPEPVPEPEPGQEAEADGQREAESTPAESKEPETMVLKTSARGAESLYVKDPETGEWINAETGGVLDYEDYKANAEDQFAQDLAVLEKHSADNQKPDEEFAKAMKEIDEKFAKDQHLQKLEKKYGTDKLGLIKATITQRAEQERENFETWQRIGDIAQVGEVSSKVVLAGADTAIDIMGQTVPGGHYVRAGYKVLKGAAGSAAEHHAKGQDWTAGATEGFIKGAGDAAGDYVKNPYAKAIVTTASESAGSAAGAYLRGEDYIQAAQNGYVDGVYKVSVGAVSDYALGSAPDVDLPDVPIRVDSTLKKIFTGKGAQDKMKTALTDEFVLKPNALEPAKNLIQVERPQFAKK